MTVFDAISKWAGEAIVNSRTLSGGCIAQAYFLETASGRQFFAKTGAVDNSMFAKEANGLRELKKAKAVRVPEVLLAESRFLLLEYIPQGRQSRTFFEDFGRAFANLHRYQAAAFGFFEDNFIGATVQKNIANGKPAEDWAAFYWENRLLFQLNLAEKKGCASEKLRQGFSRLENKIERILSGSEEAPALLHGDLWSGNFLADENGNACLIDPAVYYGHREADLAMTKLFGGFNSTFYAAYQEAYPLKPGWEYRENIYKLYHILNHLNLFGRSYLGQAERLLFTYL